MWGTPLVRGPHGMPGGWLQHGSQGCAWKGPEVTCTSQGDDPKHYAGGNPRWWVSLNFGMQWREGDTKTLKPAANPPDKKCSCIHYLHNTYCPIIDPQRDGEFKDTPPPRQEICKTPWNVSQSHSQGEMLLRECAKGDWIRDGKGPARWGSRWMGGRGRCFLTCRTS